jgi:hypothetical protein
MPRAHHAAAVMGDKMVVYGGCGPEGTLGDALILVSEPSVSTSLLADTPRLQDLQKLRWDAVEGRGLRQPAPRQSMAHCVAGGVMYVHGGFGADGLLDDMFCLDPGACRVAAGAAPADRRAAEMCVWTRIEQAGQCPGARMQHTMTTVQCALSLSLSLTLSGGAGRGLTGAAQGGRASRYWRCTAGVAARTGCALRLCISSTRVRCWNRGHGRAAAADVRARSNQGLDLLPARHPVTACSRHAGHRTRRRSG